MKVSVYYMSEYWGTVSTRNGELLIQGPNIEAITNLLESLMWAKGFSNITADQFVSTLPDRLHGRVYALVDGETF